MWFSDHKTELKLIKRARVCSFMEISSFMDGRPAEMTEVEKTGELKVGGRWMGRKEEAEREKTTTLKWVMSEVETEMEWVEKMKKYRVDEWGNDEWA